jgi:hypothetical protein
MGLHELRRTLLELVTSAAPLAGLASCYGLGGSGDDTVIIDAAPVCSEYRELSTRIPEPPPAMQEMLLRACEADPAKCTELCSALVTPYSLILTCRVMHDATGHDVFVGYDTPLYNQGCPVPGRRPQGLARARHAGRGAAAYLARAAWLEGASVHAFVGLARALRRHGAPDALCDTALRAAADEVRHAAIMGEHARSRGAAPPAVEVAPPRRRSIEAIATENAVEGEVGEAWAALVATWQARHAEDAALREAFAVIARDEASHAALAREVAAFCAERLAPAARRRVDEARRRAIGRLARGARRGAPAALVREVGLPDAVAGRRLLEGARARLWA